jgi:hypothetical protein
MAEEHDPGKKGTQEESVPELESDQRDSLGYNRTQIDLNPEASQDKDDAEHEED